jgi:hypothetical protein
LPLKPPPRTTTPRFGWGAVAKAAALVVLFAATSGTAAAETKRPPAAALIAAAKAAPLAPFQVKDEIKDLKIEAWLKRRAAAKAQIAWRATSCRSQVNGRDVYNSPVCVEAAIRFRNGVVLTVGIGFDETAPRPEQKPNAMWGTIAVKGKGCEFMRHPDYIDAALADIDVMVKAGRCE